MIYIFWTCRDEIEAKQIIYKLLDQRLIACASLLPKIESIYRWQGKIEESQEVKVIIKTLSQHFDAIQNYIQMHSTYEVPEILQVDIAQGNPSYLQWITQESTPSNPSLEE